MMNPSPLSAQDTDGSDLDFSLTDILDTLLQYLGTIVAVFVTVLVLGVLYALLATPIYRADALVQIEEKRGSTLSAAQDIATALGSAVSPVAGEIEVLRSREVIGRAIELTRSDLVVEPAYFPMFGAWLARRHDVEKGLGSPFLGLSSYFWGGEVLRIGLLDVPSRALGKPFELRATEDGFDLFDEEGQRLLNNAAIGQMHVFPALGGEGRILVQEFDANPGATATIARLSLMETYRGINQRLSVSETARQSSMVRLALEDADMQYAKNLINAIARAYLEQNVERRSAEAEQSLQFLESYLPDLKRSVETSEEALSRYQTQTNQLSVDKEAEALLEQAVSAEKERLELQLKLNQARQRFTSDHPEIRALGEQLASIAKESSRINETVNKLPGSQRDMLRLQRDRMVNNELYVALLNNAQQLKVAKAGTIGNVHIVDYAVEDTRAVAPQRVRIVGIAGLLGLFLGVLAAFGRRVLRPTVGDSDEIERATGLTSYASIPESDVQQKLNSSIRDRKGRSAIVDGRNQLLAILQPDDPAVESLRSLRTGLAFAMMGAKDNNVAFTGPTESLGKSFISANFAVLLAGAGKRVLVVDTDMRRSQLGAYFGYKGVAGLSEVLAGTRSLEQAVRHYDLNGIALDVLPAGTMPPNPGELLVSKQFEQLVQTLSSQYDHVIFDCPPVLPVGDTLAVASQIGTTFMVVRSEQSAVGEVKDAIRKLRTAGIEPKGFILNGVKPKRFRYGYGYSNNYYSYGRR